METDLEEMTVERLEEIFYKVFDSIMDKLPKEEIYTTDIERLYAKAAAKIAFKEILKERA